MEFRIETDSLGEVKVPPDKLWGAQTQRALEHFHIGTDTVPPEMITAYAIVKKAAAITNNSCNVLSADKKDLICKVCDEIINGQHSAMFPLGVWMSGSGTQLNMNINEVIANRCSQLCNEPLGSKQPVHPNDDANMSQSTNDTFPTAMHIAAATAVKQQLIPALEYLRNELNAKATAWQDIVKVGRTHLQDATLITLGQEFSGYVAMLDDNLTTITTTLGSVYSLALGGTAIGTGINTPASFDQAVATQIARLTNLPFKTATNKFSYQGAHNALVQLSSALKTLAVALYKIAHDIYLLASGPRTGLYELILPANEPGSSIMPGKVNPTQAEVLSMVAIQVMANDMAISFGGASGILEMNVYKPLIILNLMQSIHILTDSMQNFGKFLVAGIQPNKEKIAYYVEHSLALATTLNPHIGYDKVAKIVRFAQANNLTLQEASARISEITSFPDDLNK